MSPRKQAHNQADVFLGDAELGSKGGLRPSAAMKAADAANLLVSQLGDTVMLPAGRCFGVGGSGVSRAARQALGMGPGAMPIAARKSPRLCAAAVFDAAGGSALLDHVGDVVGRCAKKEMARIHARRIVAAVADKHAAWDWAVGQLPCDAVREQRAAIQLELPVAARGSSRAPRPTSRGDFDVRRKPTNLGWRHAAEFITVTY